MAELGSFTQQTRGWETFSRSSPGMRSRSSCSSCRERDSRDKLQSSCNTISLYNNALRSAKDRYPPVVRSPAAGQLRLELSAEFESTA